MKHVTFDDVKVFLITLHLFRMTRSRRSLWGQSGRRSQNKVLFLPHNDPAPPLLHRSPSFPSHRPAPPASTYVYPLNPSLPSLPRPPSHHLPSHRHFSNGRLEAAHLHLLSLSFHLHPSPASTSAGPLTLSPLPPRGGLILRVPLYFITASHPNLSPIHLSSSTTICVISPHPSPIYLHSTSLLVHPFPKCSSTSSSHSSFPLPSRRTPIDHAGATRLTLVATVRPNRMA